MGIPKGELYNTKKRTAGEIAIYSKMESITSGVAQEEIAFGGALVKGTDPANDVKHPSSVTDKFRGVAGYSASASDVENETYFQHDPVAVVESGVVMVYVEEAVTPLSTVRVRYGTGGIQGAFRASKVQDESLILRHAQYLDSAEAGEYVPLKLLYSEFENDV
ncbi:MAG: hypothetical protein JXQ76_06400 [Campylobacterales bacterium]|nr:hypothetical protein [Campylobacterales bacterium]